MTVARGYLVSCAIRKGSSTEGTNRPRWFLRMLSFCSKQTRILESCTKSSIFYHAVADFFTASRRDKKGRTKKGADGTITSVQRLPLDVADGKLLWVKFE